MEALLNALQAQPPAKRSRRGARAVDVLLACQNDGCTTQFLKTGSLGYACSVRCRDEIDARDALSAEVAPNLDASSQPVMPTSDTAAPEVPRVSSGARGKAKSDRRDHVGRSLSNFVSGACLSCSRRVVVVGGAATALSSSGRARATSAAAGSSGGGGCRLPPAA
jgi:hypothetical protein